MSYLRKRNKRTHSCSKRPLIQHYPTHVKIKVKKIKYQENYIYISIVTHKRRSKTAKRIETSRQNNTERDRYREGEERETNERNRERER